jgi:hypothetical protein
MTFKIYKPQSNTIEMIDKSDREHGIWEPLEPIYETIVDVPEEKEVKQYIWCQVLAGLALFFIFATWIAFFVFLIAGTDDHAKFLFFVHLLISTWVLSAFYLLIRFGFGCFVLKKW